VRPPFQEISMTSDLATWSACSAHALAPTRPLDDAYGDIRQLYAAPRPSGSAAFRELVRSTVETQAGSEADRPVDPRADEVGFRALLTGRWLVSDRFEADGRAYVVAHDRGAPPTYGLLSDQARAAIDLATRGVANKVIALELGVSQPTVTRLIGRALEALRLRDMREAMALARSAPVVCRSVDLALCAWHFACAASCDLQDLTVAERDIVQRIVQGASRAEIAHARGTSLYTVNSQLAIIFVKLGVGSKRELLRHVVMRQAVRAA
jgi:DNA-binding CsgD family transcriptional regulator